VALVRDLGPVLKRLLGSVREPALLDVARYPEGIPLYDPAHGARLAGLRDALRALGPLEVAGWGYDGIALGAAAASGVASARRLTGAGAP
jgi:protoporphyrinogen oxidase